MVGESLAIIAVIVVMAFMAARRGKRLFAMITLPLTSIPVLYLLSWVLRLNSLPFIITGLIAGVFVCGFFSRGFTGSPYGRAGYLVFCVVFLVALFLAYLLYT